MNTTEGDCHILPKLNMKNGVLKWLKLAGYCDLDPWRIREMCPNSCGIFIEDDRYYSEVIKSSSE